jgi:photosynthetic reaction center cytochrome c subunit
MRLCAARLILAAGLLFSVCGVAAAQTPTPPAGPAPQGQGAQPGPGGPGGMNQKPKNLKVLPAEMTRDQVTAIMRGFTGALGVRCTHCHVGQEGNPQSMDYASDDKDEKKTAREMLKMVRSINADYVRMASGDDPKADVRCETCHRGRAEPPQPLGDILVETTTAEGADAAIAKFKQMRSESLEAGQYDFRERTLVGAARRLQDDKQADKAVALLKASIELFPNSADMVASLGMTLLQNGDRDGAKAQFDKALQLDPKNGMAQQGLRRLQGGPAGPGGPPPR